MTPDCASRRGHPAYALACSPSSSASSASIMRCIKTPRGQGAGALARQAQMRTAGKALTVMSADDLVGILSPRTVRLLLEKETAPIDRARLALLSGFVLAPWAVLGSLVYVAWLLAS